MNRSSKRLIFDPLNKITCYYFQQLVKADAAMAVDVLDLMYVNVAMVLLVQIVNMVTF